MDEIEQQEQQERARFVALQLEVNKIKKEIKELDEVSNYITNNV